MDKKRLLDAAVSRRQFLIHTSIVAGGLCLSLSPLASAASSASKQVSELSPWLTIFPNNDVLVTVPSPEIGNGVSTQLALNIAEELECDWQDVRIEFAKFSRELAAPGSYAVGLQPFFGGHSTDHARMPYTMQLGASARERLRHAAANHFNDSPSSITVAKGHLIHKGSNQSVTFGQMAAAAASVVLVEEPTLKSHEEWQLLGKLHPPKQHAPKVVKGESMYGMDVNLPNMLYAAIMQSPVHGGVLKSYQPEVVENMPGVKAVVMIEPHDPKKSWVGNPTFGFDGTERSSAIAVIAESYWQAKKALAALPVEWDDGLGVFWQSNELLQQRQDKLLDKAEGMKLTSYGMLDFHRVEQVVEATYRTPFCDQLIMEPLNGTAYFHDDKLELWHPTQDMQQAFWIAVDESGLAPDKVEFNQTFVGGGFGRRTVGDDVRMVVAVAKKYPGAPIKVIWSREETMQQGAYRTPIATRFKAGLDEQGKISSLQGLTCYSGMALNIGYSDMVYAAAGNIPNLKLSSTELPTHVRTGAYRGPCYNSHIFNIECFIDECATAAGQDPVAYRLELLKDWDPGWHACLNVAAEKSGWGQPLPKGQGRGIAIGNWPMAGQKFAGSTVCAVAHVEVSNDGHLKVHSIHFTFDCGQIVNKSAVLAQLEGGIIYGLNMALYEGLTLNNGRIAEGNFDRAQMVRLNELPEIHIHFDALSGHERHGIIGEAPVGPIGPAIANAIYQASGKRLRSTPFKDHDLSWK